MEYYNIKKKKGPFCMRHNPYLNILLSLMVSQPPMYPSLCFAGGIDSPRINHQQYRSRPSTVQKKIVDCMRMKFAININFNMRQKLCRRNIIKSQDGFYIILDGDKK